MTCTCGAERGERHDSDCKGFLGTGIRDLRSARSYLRAKFSLGAQEAVVSRPLARFYVTALSAGRSVFLAGPYAGHMAALSAVPRVRARLQLDWLSVGTASHPQTLPTRLGRV